MSAQAAKPKKNRAPRAPKRWSRQTAALLEQRVERVRAVLRGCLRGLAWGCAATSVAVALGALLVWTDLTRYDIFAVSPSGTVHRVPLIER